MSYLIVIPARYQSERLPGKPLLDLDGKPVIQRVFEQCQQTKAKRVIIATDDDKIASACKSFGAEVCMTSARHESGTVRLAEVIAINEIDDDEVVVNVQGDEPLIPPENIEQVADNLTQHLEASIATLCTKITEAKDVFDPNIVKVIWDESQFALYFSRAPIPWDRAKFTTDQANTNTATAYRHIGLYAYRASFLKAFTEWSPSPLEQLERLEQLRAMHHRKLIHVDIASTLPPIGIDTEDDLQRVRAQLKGR